MNAWWGSLHSTHLTSQHATARKSGYTHLRGLTNILFRFSFLAFVACRYYREVGFFLVLI